MGLLTYSDMERGISGLGDDELTVFGMSAERRGYREMAKLAKDERFRRDFRKERVAGELAGMRRFIERLAAMRAS